MSRSYATILMLIVTVFSSCSATRVNTLWHDYNGPSVCKTIMVAAITRDSDTLLRKQIEEKMVAQLDSIGLNAVSSLAIFGEEGLSPLNETATYFQLCNRGIDAIVTIARIEKAEKIGRKDPANAKYTSVYYYNRIWGYKELKVADIDHRGQKEVRWECILFDLDALQPRYVAQAVTPAYPVDNNEFNFLKKFLSNMLRSDVLRVSEVKRKKPAAF